jgi:uncharacterized membrane protein YbhN (UPF0104 family)
MSSTPHEARRIARERGQPMQRGGEEGRARPAGPGRWRRYWPWIRRTLFTAFALVVLYLIAQEARHVDWQRVMGAVEQNTWPVLARAAGMAVLSYLIYSCFDLLAIPYIGHMIPPGKVIPVGIVAYAFNLNMGSLIGSVGFRYRLYTKLGLGLADVTRIVGLSLATNWVGYLWIGGVLFAWGLLPLPESWPIGTRTLQWIGAGMLAAAVLYVGVCGLARRRSWTVRGHELELPSLRVAVAQSLLGAACWASIGGVVWILLLHDVSYPMILGCLLLSGIAGAMTHIPGGLGVVEAVFIAMLSGKLHRYEILGTLLTYRAIYYLAPFVIAAFIYLWLELGIRKRARRPA